MNKTIDTLANLLKKDVTFVQSEEGDDAFKGITYEIYEEGNEDLLAVCVLDLAGNLVNYYQIDSYKQGDFMSGDMQSIAEKFIKAFYPQGLEEYLLQSIIDLDETYIVTYGIKDEKYGIQLPGIGFSLTISTGGEVVQFCYDHDQVDIVYPAQMISEAEAKEKYASLVDFELIIRQTDTEIYKNGDNAYRLVYALKKAAVDIPTSGEEPVVVEEGNCYEPIQQQDGPSVSIYELIGMTENYVKLGEHVDEDLVIKKWRHVSIPQPEEIDFTEAYAEQMITIHFDRETNMPTFIYNGEQWQGERVQQADNVLQKKALDFLFKIFPEAHEHFVMEIEETEDEEWAEAIDDEFEGNDGEEWNDLDEGSMEENEEEEKSIAFYFQYHANGVPVEKVTCIQVGTYSGNIVSASIEPVNQTFLAQINTKPILSKEDAKKQFMRKLHMELSMTLAYDEDGKPFYHLTYLPSFQETIGHIQMIDAENGKAYFVDIGDTQFF
ncbi:YcdB/YcdC domain-containing protein [Sporosarcina sp. HYO08]|uniref:YcdB/YcdC domain-containing protein n=1 Tax=Sporosarcina sp. HYO08 TaxID=1759557 RepID=UPI0007930D92|nr:YcdB/YcdC domain-containing protein [Sporosarcina sp. HYO08]KXH79264.1 hypothetical protein AU377_11800 [Sporosarcina sp. HYO08]